MSYRDENYYKNRIYPNISKDKIVFTGDTAFLWNGFSVSGVFVPDVLTDHLELKGVKLSGFVNYHYIPEVDTQNYVQPFMNNSKILVPTVERAIVENIKYGLKFIDEGYFCDALERYQNSKQFDFNLLKHVAEFYNTPINKVEYWLKESEDYNSH